MLLRTACTIVVWSFTSQLLITEIHLIKSIIIE